MKKTPFIWKKKNPEKSKTYINNQHKHTYTVQRIAERSRRSKRDLLTNTHSHILALGCAPLHTHTNTGTRTSFFGCVFGNTLTRSQTSYWLHQHKHSHSNTLKDQIVKKLKKYRKNIIFFISKTSFPRKQKTKHKSLLRKQSNHCSKRECGDHSNQSQLNTHTHIQTNMTEIETFWRTKQHLF